MRNSIYSLLFSMIVLLFGMLFLSACNDAISSVSSIKQLPTATQISSAGNNYTISFSPPSTAMPLNKYFTMDVVITGATQQTLPFPVTLDIDAGMKAHNHGMNVKPKIHNLGAGHFKFEEMLLHMPGDWFLSFDVHRGLLIDKAEINMVVRP